MFLCEMEVRALVKVWGNRVSEMADKATATDIEYYGKKFIELAEALDPKPKHPVTTRPQCPTLIWPGDIG